VAAVCRTLGVARSWLYYVRRGRARVQALRRPEVATAIRAVLPGRPASYGYRRIHALLVRGGLRCDPKTVYRQMRRHRWLAVGRRQRPRPGRRHDGQVAVATPNRRWATDITTLKTGRGEKLRFAVIVDCADRMILAWRGQPRVRAEDIGEMVREALWQRFGPGLGRARGLEFLSDNGPEFSARRLRTLLAHLGLVRCHTPCRSPESNGLAESFFGSFKRDYLAQHWVETRAELLGALPGWIRDDNEVAPHSALGMRAPAEFHREWVAKHGSTPVQK